MMLAPHSSPIETSSPELVFMTYGYECNALVDAGEFVAAVDAMRPGIELMRRQGMHRSHQSWLETIQAVNQVECIGADQQPQNCDRQSPDVRR